MPIPIRPNSYQQKSESPMDSKLNLTLDMLSQMLNNHSASIKKEAEVADTDASLVFALWENSKILRDAGNIEDRLYGIPNNVTQSELTRLKTRGFIYGEKDQIRFTNHAAKIIKMMVLAEGNAFGKQAVKKPYSMILAESKVPKRRSNLALAEKLANQNPDLK